MKNSLIFAAVVWIIAGSFVVVDIVSLRGMDVLMAHPDLFEPLLLSAATKRSTACLVRADERTAAVGLTDAQGRYGAWSLGLRVGQTAVVRQLTMADRQALAQSEAGIAQIASVLGVEAPASFAPRQVASAITEFISFVEVDSSQTAHQLAVRYSPEACQLYKLGAFWGYSMLVRLALPGEHPLFSIEIHHYARQVGLGEQLWRPMTERAPRDTPSDRIASDMSALTDGVTSFLLQASRGR